MNYYSKEQTASIHSQHFSFLIIEEKRNVLHITLNREAKKNALHPQMVNEIAFAMSYAHTQNTVWMVLFKAKGTVFCAGADLQAAMGMIEEHTSTIPAPAQEILIGELFNKIHKPTIAQIEGDVYAGGFFFLAGCHIVISRDDVKFGLPEVKRGLFPFQVMSSLLRVMPARKVLDWCIRGYNLPVADAQACGLITKSVPVAQIDQEVNKVIDELKQNSPSAIRLGLEAYDKLQSGASEHKYLMDMLTKTISTKDGQEGIMAFRQKRQPVWVGE